MLILQPTPFCNIDCDYCYLPQRTRKDRMSVGVVAAALESLATSNLLKDKLTVVWHAGEPLVLPAEYFSEVLALVASFARNDLTVEQAVQTNLTLLTPEHCEVFRRFEVSVGVSIDGPAEFHDAHRRTRRGEGTFESVMRGIELLRSHGLAFNVICVLSASSLDAPEELYHFFRSLGARDVAFNVEEQEGVHEDSSVSGVELERRFADFMRRFFALLLADDEPMNVREFRHFHDLLRSGHRVGINNQADPFAIVSVSVDGSFSTFSPELLGQAAPEYDGFTLGNVLEGPVVGAVATERFERLAADVERGVSLCSATCDYYRFCGGGAPSNKYFENGALASTETTFCRLTRKVLADVFIESLEASTLTALE